MCICGWNRMGFRSPTSILGRSPLGPLGQDLAKTVPPRRNLATENHRFPRGSQGFPGTGQIAYDPSRHGADELEAMVFSMAGMVTVFSPTKKNINDYMVHYMVYYMVFKIVMVHIIGLNPRKQTHQTLVFHDQSSSRKISKDHKPLK